MNEPQAASPPRSWRETIFLWLITPAYGVFYCGLYLLVGACGFAAWLLRLEITMQHYLSVASSPRRRDTSGSSDSGA